MLLFTNDVVVQQFCVYIMPAVCSILNDLVVAAYGSAVSKDFPEKHRQEILLSLYNVVLSQN